MPYFRCVHTDSKSGFVIELLNEEKIAHARAIISRAERAKTQVSGKVLKQSRPYNRPWSWHLDPASIEFFELAAEVCDAAPEHLEKHLDEVGGAFLPKDWWCPWGSRVVAEID